MNNSKFINSIKKLFKRENSKRKKYPPHIDLFSTGEEDFKKGYQYYKEATLTNGSGWQEKKKRLNELALECFDKALNKKYKTSKLFALRADCLDNLEYYFDAIEDYNKALGMNPIQGIAHGYWRRE